MKNKNEAVELADCPFCGNKPDQQLAKMCFGRQKYRIVCCQVFIEAPKDVAIKKWNTRTPTQCKSDDGKCEYCDSPSVTIQAGNKVCFNHVKVGSDMPVMPTELPQELDDVIMSMYPHSLHKVYALRELILQLLKSKGW